MDEKQSLIVVTQLPIIQNQLQEVKASIDRRIEEALSLAVTEDSLKVAKSIRAALNKEYKQLEDKRKEVKKLILEPYEKFEAVYNDCAATSYQKADAILKKRIEAVEDTLKVNKRVEIEHYFNEYRESLRIPDDLVSFKSIGITVTLSASQKALKEQVKSFLDKIKEDIDVIALQEHADEIMTEFRTTRNASTAIATVTLRHQRIEEERKRREDEAAERAEAAKAAERVEIIAEEEDASLSIPCTVEAPVNDEPVPTESPAEGKVYSTTFRVYGTIPQLKSLKEFLTNGGFKYEQQ